MRNEQNNQQCEIMTSQQVIDYCLEKPGAYIDYPWGFDVAVIKVGKTENKGGRVFAQVFMLKGKNSVTLNCDMMVGMMYRDMFPNIVVRGYHCTPVQQPYFNTFPLSGEVPNDMIIEMLEHSYKTVVNKLPKYVQKMLG